MQIIKGGRGWDSLLAWIKGLVYGLLVKIKKEDIPILGKYNSQN